MIPLNINFLKSQPTVGELRKVTREAQSPINLTRGDKLSARTGSKTLQTKSEGFHHHSFTPSDNLGSLKRTTSDLLSKININNIKNTETFKGDVIRSMGIEVL